MTQIKNFGSNIIIKQAEDVLPLYKTYVDTPKIGIEYETDYFACAEDTLRPVTQAEQDRALQALVENNISTGVENIPSVIEFNSDPFSVSKPIRSLIDNLKQGISHQRAVMAQQELTPSPMGNVPQFSHGMNDIVQSSLPDFEASNMRYQTFSSRWLQDMPGVHKYFTEQVCIQGSVTAHSADELLDIARVALAAGPFFMDITGANPGFIDDHLIDGDPRLIARAGLGHNGGYPDLLFDAQDGGDYIRKHIDYVMNDVPMMAVWTHDGELVALPEGETTTFAQLGENGLGPQSLQNYLQAQSMGWNLLNITPVKDNDQVIAHRLEICLFNSGPMHQYATSAMILKALTDPSFRSALAGNLKDKFDIDVYQLARDKEKIATLYERAKTDRAKLSQEYYQDGFAEQFVNDMRNTLKDEKVDEHMDTLRRIITAGPDWLITKRYIESGSDLNEYFAHWTKTLKNNPEVISPTTCLTDHENRLFTASHTQDQDNTPHISGFSL